MALQHSNGNGQLLRAALALARSGKQVFPCEPRGKKPACAHGLNDATSALTVIERWWREDPYYNIGLATGLPSGVLVLDVDVHKHTGETVGADSLRELEAKHGPLPPTIKAFTPRGGEHDYFRWPEGRDVRCSTGRLGVGLDIRAAGGYVIAPPSIGQTGAYVWSVDNTHLADAPPWLLDAICEPKAKARLTAPPTDWRAQLAGSVGEGNRNDLVTRLCGHLMRCRVDPYLAHELLQAFNSTHCAPPLDPTEISTIVNSIAVREAKRRQGLL